MRSDALLSIGLNAGVLCVEELDLALAPLALAVEQEHAAHLVGFVRSATEPFSGSRPGAARQEVLAELTGIAGAPLPRLVSGLNDRRIVRNTVAAAMSCADCMCSTGLMRESEANPEMRCLQVRGGRSTSRRWRV